MTERVGELGGHITDVRGALKYERTCRTSHEEEARELAEETKADIAEVEKKYKR